MKEPVEFTLCTPCLDFHRLVDIYTVALIEKNRVCIREGRVLAIDEVDVTAHKTSINLCRITEMSRDRLETTLAAAYSHLAARSKLEFNMDRNDK